jgi:homoserine dehydrogenase
MRTSRRDFSDVLSEAQELGYAEADPGFDIDGIDSAHKLAILTALAFGQQVDFSSVQVEGIRNIDLSDISYANELGYRIKSLATASNSEDGILQSVSPCLVPATSPLAAVEGVVNAVELIAAHAGAVVLQGRGAGGGPTASAVIADILDIARGNIPYAFGVPAASLALSKPADPSKRVSAYYLRLKVLDQPGVVADIAAILRDNDVSLESVLQRGHFPDGTVPLVLVTHLTQDGKMRAAVKAITALDSVTGHPCLLPIVMN